jgi:phospholipid/cholesterol/gamma-HCH transport system permease protein
MHASDQSVITIGGDRLTGFDSAGALVLLECINLLQAKQATVTLTGFSEEQHALITLISDKKNNLTPSSAPSKSPGLLHNIGKEAVNKCQQIDGLIVLIGDLADKLFLAALNWRRLQIPSIVSNVKTTGIQALPILALLSFLIGVVLAYQMGLQLETYGANAFIAYLSGMAIFREFAPLITAIIVAGRTSSAFTAQIGSMKINEEVDALNTMGLSPTELLVVPKVIALLIIFPLIIFWSDMFSLFGAMLMSKLMLDVGYYDFLTRIQTTVGVKQLLLGLYKAPAFAILIALVGCFQGFRVEASADSVGRQTTRSVVQALFLIIITDATYSIIYSWLNL